MLWNIINWIMMNDDLIRTSGALIECRFFFPYIYFFFSQMSYFFGVMQFDSLSVELIRMENVVCVIYSRGCSFDGDVEVQRVENVVFDSLSQIDLGGVWKSVIPKSQKTGSISEKVFLCCQIYRILLEIYRDSIRDL